MSEEQFTDGMFDNHTAALGIFLQDSKVIGDVSSFLAKALISLYSKNNDNLLNHPERKKAADEIDRFVEMMLLTTIVDKFLNYVTDLLTLLYVVRPETLKSNETERLDFILEYTSMQELISAIAEKKVNELAFKSLKDLTDYLSKRGFELFSSDSDKQYVSKLVEVRNIIVHNRGRIGKISVRRFPEFSDKIGQVLDMKEYDTAAVYTFVSTCVRDIDNRAARHFQIGFGHISKAQESIYIDFLRSRGFRAEQSEGPEK
jgi:hypothetical protein